jgi:hypothetical protein
MPEFTRREAMQVAAVTGATALSGTAAIAEAASNLPKKNAGEVPVFLRVEMGLKIKAGKTVYEPGQQYTLPVKMSFNPKTVEFTLPFDNYHTQIVLGQEDLESVFVFAGHGCRFHVEGIYASNATPAKNRNLNKCCLECMGTMLCGSPPICLECGPFMMCCDGF